MRVTMDILRLAGDKGLQLIMADITRKDSLDKKEEKVISSGELFGDKKQVWIRHGETLYRLLITRQGKLILNK